MSTSPEPAWWGWRRASSARVSLVQRSSSARIAGTLDHQIVVLAVLQQEARLSDHGGEGIVQGVGCTHAQPPHGFEPSGLVWLQTPLSGIDRYVSPPHDGVIGEPSRIEHGPTSRGSEAAPGLSRPAIRNSSATSWQAAGRQRFSSSKAVDLRQAGGADDRWEKGRCGTETRMRAGPQ